MMPRDMDLIRELMLRFEHDDTSVPDGSTKQEVAYHVKQMWKSGLIDAEVTEAPSPGKRRPIDFIIHDITPAGHDFITAIRNERFWSKVKDEFRKKAAPATVELIVFVAKQLGRQAVEFTSNHLIQGHGSHTA
jgi:hypothetical protein